MQLGVMKTGAENLDACHAYGLSELIIRGINSPVKLSNHDGYWLLDFEDTVGTFPSDLLFQLFQIPSLEMWDFQSNKGNPFYQTFDGILAVGSTTKGPRVPSICNLEELRSYNPLVLEKTFHKVEKMKQRWLSITSRQVPASGSSWKERIFNEYSLAKPANPGFKTVRSKNYIIIPMTVEPGLGFSPRSALSDGETKKVSITISGYSYANILTILGASRFLRAQKVSHGEINFYVPIAKEITIDRSFYLESLSSIKVSSDQAAAIRVLDLLMETKNAVCWQSLNCLTMKTQGPLAPITNNWLSVGLEQSWQVEGQLLFQWRQFLSKYKNENGIEQENLTSFILNRSAEDWFQHLIDVSLNVASQGIDSPIVYTLEEARKGFRMADRDVFSPSEILLREWGTFIIGRALKQLGEVYPAAKRDIEDELLSVNTRDHLIVVAGKIAAECSVAKGKSPYIFVPTHNDFFYLLEDVDKFSAKTVAVMLFTIANFWNSRKLAKPSSINYQDVSGEGEENEPIK